MYLAGISGDTIGRDRIGSGEGRPEQRVILRPCLNVFVMVQPDKYLDVAAHPALRTSGALARIWPAWLLSMVGRQHERLGEPGLYVRAVAEDPWLETARRTLAQLGRRDEAPVTTRTLSLYGPRPRPNAKTASAVLELLEDLGWLRAEPIRGRQKPRYPIHPY